ncbi:DUF1128 domain-containing protein [Virgibacillus ainsalahensis]
MNLDYPSQENMKIILNELADRLNVVNRTILDPDDYNIDKYDDLKLMYDMILQKGNLSAAETQAFIEELRTVRKS